MSRDIYKEIKQAGIHQVLFTKSFWWVIHQSFLLPKVCAIQYIQPLNVNTIYISWMATYKYFCDYNFEITLYLVLNDNNNFAITTVALKVSKSEYYPDTDSPWNLSTKWIFDNTLISYNYFIRYWAIVKLMLRPKLSLMSWHNFENYRWPILQAWLWKL